MKLKEAQMLGILGLIAVCIVLLCMWGSEEGARQPAGRGGAQVLQEEGAGPSLAELYEELLRSDDESFRTAEKREEATVKIGGSPVVAPVPSEEAVIRTVIEERQPQDIGLQPVRATVEPRAPAAPAPERAPRPRFHIVEKGDTLSGISQRYYGTIRGWPDILSANRRTISAPEDLRPGMKLTIPVLEASGSAEVAAAAPARPALSAAAASAQRTAASAQRTYTVQKGDTLWTIAQKCYDDGSRWREVQATNRRLVPDADRLRPGIVLVIP